LGKRSSRGDGGQEGGRDQCIARARRVEPVLAEHAHVRSESSGGGAAQVGHPGTGSKRGLGLGPAQCITSSSDQIPHLRRHPGHNAEIRCRRDHHLGAARPQGGHGGSQLAGGLLRRHEVREVVGADDDQRNLRAPVGGVSDLSGQGIAAGPGYGEDAHRDGCIRRLECLRQSRTDGVGGLSRALAVGNGVSEHRKIQGHEIHQTLNSYGAWSSSRSIAADGASFGDEDAEWVT
jgi:hypothetical protein